MAGQDRIEQGSYSFPASGLRQARTRGQGCRDGCRAGQGVTGAGGVRRRFLGRVGILKKGLSGGGVIERD
jgi:hypothetical protein